MILTYALWACILAIGFFLGLAVGEETNLESFLKNWQTLIAGVLAIGAALFTVNEMRRVEGMQQRRHEDLMKLNLRADRQRLARIQHMLENSLNRSADDLLGIRQLTQENRDMAVSDVSAFKDEINQMLEGIESIVHWDAVTDAKPMFDADAAVAHRAIVETIANIRLYTGQWLETVRYDVSDHGLARAAMRKNAALDAMRALEMLCREFPKAVNNLVAEYD